jgi:F-type H+-transporting ATPase subunit epsilon
MHVHIAQVNSVLYNGQATALTVPGVEGEMTILPHHEALISTLKAGLVTVQFEGGNEVFTIAKGLLEVSGNKATVLLTE